MVNFHIGTYDLIENSNFNFQLNRIIAWDGGVLEDVKKVASAIHTSSDWKSCLIKTYLFEDPRQGGVLRLQDKCFTYEWVKPVKSVLDKLHLYILKYYEIEFSKKGCDFYDNIILHLDR